jgi:hypothetical protein
MIKLIGLTFFVGASMAVATVVNAAAFLAVGGIALCRVDTPEVHLTIPVPTHVIDAGLLAARIAVPEQEMAEVRREVEPWAPMIESVTRALADLPDGTVLVSVVTAEETVQVARRGGRWRVDVDAEDAEVHVSIPVRSVKRIARGVTSFL